LLAIAPAAPALSRRGNLAVAEVANDQGIAVEHQHTEGEQGITCPCPLGQRHVQELGNGLIGHHLAGYDFEPAGRPPIVVALTSQRQEADPTPALCWRERADLAIRRNVHPQFDPVTHAGFSRGRVPGGLERAAAGPCLLSSAWCEPPPYPSAPGS